MSTVDYRELPDILTRAEMSPMYQAAFFVDGLVFEDDDRMVFRKVVSMDDPFIGDQKIRPPKFPHHLAGECYISLTGQTAAVMLVHKGIITPEWRGHGTRIRQAVFRDSALVGETVFVEITMVKHRKMWKQLFCTFAYRMFKYDAHGREKLCYESEQEAVFFETEKDD